MIPKSSSISRIRENFDIMSFELTDEQVNLWAHADRDSSKI